MRKHLVSVNFWLISALLITLVMLTPLFAIFSNALGGSNGTLEHFYDTVLGVYVYNTVVLVVLTVLFSVILALPSAIIVSHFQFYGKNALQWLFCLPLAIPAYLIAYIYTDLLDYSGGVQSTLRALFAWQSAKDYYFPNIRSLEGASFIMALTLYPYIFLMVRVALLEQSENLSQSAKVMGVSALRYFFTVLLPLIRPAIVLGATLVAMETLGDFGTVSFFSIQTMTTAIYNAWLSFHDLATASRIALFMLALVLFFMVIEQYSRRRQYYFQRGFEQKQQCYRVSGIKLVIIYLWSGVIVALAFVIPLLQLIWWAIEYWHVAWTGKFVTYAINSLKVSTTTAIVTVVLALILHGNQRLTRAGFGKHIGKLLLRCSSLGYALPGTVLAIGLVSILSMMDFQLHYFLKWIGASPVGLIFSGSMFALVLAHSIRFSAMAIGAIEASMNQISPSLDMASRSLGVKQQMMVRRVHLPLLSKGIITAMLMVFIDSIKELNASILLRPFNFETIATYLFNLTSTEQMEEGALSAVILVVIGTIPVIILTKSLIKKADKGR